MAKTARNTANGKQKLTGHACHREMLCKYKSEQMQTE